MTIEPKKLAPLRILQILQKYSSPEHPLLQDEISDHLCEYGLVLERKAIGRNLAYLCDAGFHIVNIPKQGYYLEAFGFNSFDLHLIINAVLSSKHIESEHARELVKKLNGLANRDFSFSFGNVEYLGERSEESMKQLFDVLGRVNWAIDSKRQIEFDYEEDEGKKYCRAIPRRILLHGQTYYLFAHNGDGLAFYRFERMSNVYPIVSLNERLSDPGRDLAAEENAIEAFFHREPHDEP